MAATLIIFLAFLLDASSAQTCSIDFEACEELAFGVRPGKNCEAAAFVKLIDRADCYSRRLNDLKRTKDCNCESYKVTKAVSHMSSANINSTAKFLCMKTDELQNCPSKSCLVASGVHIFSQFFEQTCGPKEREMVAVFKKCLTEYDNRQKDFSNCGYIDYTLSTHGEYYRAFLNVMCTGCPIMKAISECNKNRAITMSPCRNVAELKLLKACVESVMKKYESCGARGELALSNYVKRYMDPLLLRCRAQKMYENNQKKWGCPRYLWDTSLDSKSLYDREVSELIPEEKQLANDEEDVEDPKTQDESETTKQPSIKVNKNNKPKKAKQTNKQRAKQTNTKRIKKRKSKTTLKRKDKSKKKSSKSSRNLRQSQRRKKQKTRKQKSAKQNRKKSQRKRKKKISKG